VFRPKARMLYALTIILFLTTSLFGALLPKRVRGTPTRLLGSGSQDENLIKGGQPLGQTVFEGSDVDGKGNVFVGCNYGVFKSADNGQSFTLVFTIPPQPNPWALMAGRIWCVYVDSRDYVFVSAISTNRLYRSTDGGTSFVEVLNLNRTNNDGGIINMDEDELGGLYACEYGADKSARLFESSSGGNPGSWSSIRDFDTRHLHNVRMNPFNDWLYVATSEDSGLGDTESRSVFRSKDHGASWTRVVQQSGSLSGFVAMQFCSDWVVLGEDNAGQYSSIDRFRDDGSSQVFTTQTVWTNPSITNFYGGTKLGDHLVFATGRENHDGTLYVLESTDGQNWCVVDSLNTSSGDDNYRGILNPHPDRNGRVYTCQSAGSAVYYVINTPPVIDGIVDPHEYDAALAIKLTGQWDTGWTVNGYLWWDKQFLDVAVNEPVPGQTTGRSSWIEFCIDAGPARSYLDCFCFFGDGSLQYCGYPKPSGGWAWYPSPFPWSAVTNSATEFQINYTEYGIAYGDTIRIAVDRNLGPPPPNPLGKSAYWPGHEEIVYPTPEVDKWGTLTLGSAQQSATADTHVVDGVLGPHEYDGAMTVQLVGRTDMTWTETAYIDWDSQYLYVAVNESVPATSGHISWIEFAMDGGSARPYLDAFVLFDDHVPAYDRYVKPSGPWTGMGRGSFSAASNVCTEFKIKYTDYGIALGDTIKISIDRNHGPSPPPPYGFAAFWPQSAVVYDGTPNQADPSTWGDVYLNPAYPLIYVDPEVIARVPAYVNSTFEVSVKVEDVPDLFGFDINLTWDATLLTFVSLDKTTLETVWPQGFFEPLPLPGFKTGLGYVDFAAVATGGKGFTGSETLFTVTFRVAEASNFQLTTTIHFSTPKLSNSTANSIPAVAMDASYTIGAKQPGIGLVLVDPDSSKPFEYGKTFEVEVYAVDVTNMTNFDLTILFDANLLNFVNVGYWGVFGTGSFGNASGNVHVWNGAGVPCTGDKLLLFALTFHVKFNDYIDHIWRTGRTNELNAAVSTRSDAGFFGFTEGIIPITGIVLPSSINVTVNLIKGDVDCSGKVDILDLRTVAAYFDKSSTDPGWAMVSKYDVKTDNKIDIYDLVIISSNFGYPNP
jgi:hypothetical protein